MFLIYLHLKQFIISIIIKKQSVYIQKVLELDLVFKNALNYFTNKKGFYENIKQKQKRLKPVLINNYNKKTTLDNT